MLSMLKPMRHRMGVYARAESDVLRDGALLACQTSLDFASPLYVAGLRRFPGL